MQIRMTIEVPLEMLHKTVQYMEKHKISIKGTSFTGNEHRKMRKFLTDTERADIASIKDRGRGMSVQVAQEWGISPDVVRKIWKQKK